MSVYTFDARQEMEPWHFTSAELELKVSYSYLEIKEKISYIGMYETSLFYV